VAAVSVSGSGPHHVQCDECIHAYKQVHLFANTPNETTAIGVWAGVGRGEGGGG
jgi:hypothetical protein